MSTQISQQTKERIEAQNSFKTGSLAESKPEEAQATPTMCDKRTLNRRLGDSGEELVADLYKSAGFRIVARNWTCREGELDIVAQSSNYTVFCEVKTRTSARFVDPSETVGYRKQCRVRKAALLWLSEQQGWMPHMRFDVATVIGSKISIIENAF